VLKFVVVFSLVTCAPPQGRVVEVAGLRAWMPAEAIVRDAEEPLRARARIAHAYDGDGARFEIARFTTLRPLDEDEARTLLAKTVRALSALPGARDPEVAMGDDERDAILALRFADGTRGRWHLAVVDDHTFWQISVVGEDRPAIWQRADRFFASIRFPDR
jgi:hypothetical protein